MTEKNISEKLKNLLIDSNFLKPNESLPEKKTTKKSSSKGTKRLRRSRNRSSVTNRAIPSKDQKINSNNEKTDQVKIFEKWNQQFQV